MVLQQDPWGAGWAATFKTIAHIHVRADAVWVHQCFHFSKLDIWNKPWKFLEFHKISWNFTKCSSLLYQLYNMMLLIPDFFNVLFLSFKIPQIPENSWISGEVAALGFIFVQCMGATTKHLLFMHGKNWCEENCLLCTPTKFYHISIVICIWQLTSEEYFVTWEQKGNYRCTKCMAIAPFWFSTEHCWTALMPFWLSGDDL